MLKRVVEEPAANRKMSLFDPHLGPEVSFTEASLKSGFQIEKWTFAVTIRVSNTHFKRVPISVTFFGRSVIYFSAKILLRTKSAK